MNRRLELLSCGLLAWSLLSSCSAPPPDPRELFLRAAEAAEATPLVRYRFEAIVSSSSGDRRLEGTALIQRLDLSGASFRAHIDGAITDESGDATTRLVAVRQHDDVYLLDATTRKAEHASLYSGGSSLLYRLDPALMYAFYDPRAVASEAEAAEVVSEGVGSVHGESCQLVRVSYTDDEEDSRWCLRERDGLPLLMEWIGPETTTSLTIFDIEPLETVSDAAFEVEIPDAWEVRERGIGPPRGSQVEPWSLADARGEAVTLDDLRGQVVVLDFWATWCPPCITTLDNLEDLQGHYSAEPVRFIAVNTMESGDPHAFIAERGYTFEAVFGGDDLHSQVAPGSLPAFAVIDAHGNWLGAGVGYYGEGSEQYMTGLIDAALSTVE